jgi:hypothetical protein
MQSYFKARAKWYLSRARRATGRLVQRYGFIRWAERQGQSISIHCRKIEAAHAVRASVFPERSKGTTQRTLALVLRAARS